MQGEQKWKWNPHLLLVAMLLAGGYTFASYPGIVYTDSAARAQRALSLARGEDWSSIYTYLSIIPQFFIALFFKITWNFATYTWMQATFFLWSVLAFCWHFFSGWGRWAAALLLMTCPVIVGFSTFWEMGVVAAGGLLCLMVLDDCLQTQQPSPQQKGAGWKRRVALFLYGFCAFVVVGYRLNAATAIIGLALWNLFRAWRRAQSKKDAFKKAAAGLLGMVLALTFPRLIGNRGVSNMAYGFFWESLCIVDVAAEDAPAEELETYFDDILGEGVTKTVIDKQVGIASDYYLDWGTYEWVTMRCGPQVYQKYLHLAVAYPGAFLKVKGTFILKNLCTLPNLAFSSGLDTGTFFAAPTPRRDLFVQVTCQYMEWTPWLRTPYIMFLLAIGLAVLQYRFTRKAKVPAMLIFTAACYEGAFFITSQSFDYRYFFPAGLLLVFSCLLSLQALLPIAWRRLRRRAE